MEILVYALAIGLVVLGFIVAILAFVFLTGLILPLLEAVFNFAEDLGRKLFGP